MKTPKVPEVKLPYATRVASYAADSGSAPPSAISSASQPVRPVVGQTTSRVGRPSLLGGV